MQGSKADECLRTVPYQVRPKITVITVCFNAIDRIEKTIQSIITQTYKNIEYIVIDGGSTDGTVEVVKKYASRITCWISEPDNGIYDAMNKGIRVATGEWLIMMNAGDYFVDANVLNKVFENSIPEDISFLYGDVYFLQANGMKIFHELSFGKGRLVHQAIIYRRKLHEEHGMYIVTPQIIISDYLFFMRIPVEQVMKVNAIIAVYEEGGISAHGNWLAQQVSCADVVFRRRTFGRMLLHYLKIRIAGLIPIEAKNKMRIIWRQMCGARLS